MSNAITYSNFMEVVNPLGQRAVNINNIIEAVNLRQISPTEGAQIIENYTGRKITFVKDVTSNAYTSVHYVDNVTKTVPNPYNSNASAVQRGTVKTPITTTIDPTTGKVKAGKIISPSSVGTRAYVANSIASPLVAVATGITLGKIVDSALYNANPDFWDSRGMSSLNPETWNRITSGLDTTDPITGVSAGLMNLILGLDPESGESQAYIDQDAFAYMAAYMNSQNAFDTSIIITDEACEDIGVSGSIYPYDVSVNNFVDISWPSGAKYISSPLGQWTNREGVSGLYLGVIGSTYNYNLRIALFINPNGYPYIIAASDSYIEPQPVKVFGFTADNIANKYGHQLSASLTYYYTYTRNGKTAYIWAGSLPISNPTTFVPYLTTSTYNDNKVKEIGWLLVYGDTDTISGVEGIDTQTGAQTPDVSTWGDYANVLPSLQQQYPQLWNDAIDYPIVQPDGTVDNRKYIPISLPQSFTEGQPTPYTQPISSGATQANPEIDPGANPEFADWVARLMQQPTDNPLDPNYTSSENPSDTGDGSSPTSVVPTGNASALWSIYHPTQAEIDSFGAWLWSPSFIDQIAKIFNNPMESIIGLHKVYASPVDAGTSTIHVGYLDSGVSSAYIEQQYVYIDCGSVDILEQYGNALDYTSTNVKLYLPFIGIVSLNVSEVMRSTLSITYGVDLLTGACLAMVDVSRDGNTSTLYQYAGNCAVSYPLSMGSYMGIVSSILGVAGSAVATFASGGTLAPLAIGAASSAFNAHTNIQNSGSFSGNAGAMGGKIPYIIIERAQSAIPDTIASFEGLPANNYVILGECSGFVQCKDVHLTGIDATSEELDQIQNYLKEGVLL